MSTNLAASIHQVFIFLASALSVSINLVLFTKRRPIESRPTMDGIVNTTTRCRFPFSQLVEDSQVIIALIPTEKKLFHF